MIPIDVLKEVGTISELKILVYLYENSNEKGVVKTSKNKITDDSGVSRNSVKKALETLIENELVKVIHEGRVNTPSIYMVSKVDPPSKVDTLSTVDTPLHEQEGWTKAVGARKKAESSKVDTDNNNNIYINNIIKKDFKEYNYIHEDINSLSIINENHSLNDKQLGVLARRVLIEWFLPLASIPADASKNKSFFPMQMKHIKDLLVEYRTEQVLAAIMYWCKVNPPANGMRSIMWLKYERRGTTHVQVALDHYKNEYLANEGEIKEEERLAKVEEMKEKALEIVKQKQEEKKVVDAMSDQDFLSNLIGGLGKINIKE